MAGYSSIWRCDKCNQRQETMDSPKVRLCDKCDDVTKERCVGCGKLTNITPQMIYRKRGARYASCEQCVIVDAPPAPPQRTRRYNLIGGISENFHPEDH